MGSYWQISVRIELKYIPDKVLLSIPSLLFTAGRVNQEFRQGQRHGLPYPILWIAEYFTIDGEGIRWGRHYRQAGWYTHVLLWLVFPIYENVFF